MHLNYLLTWLLNLFLILGRFDIEGCDLWYACTEPYYGADDEIKHSLSTSGKLFHPFILH